MKLCNSYSCLLFNHAFFFRNSFDVWNLLEISTWCKRIIVSWWKAVPFTLISTHLYFREFMGIPYFLWGIPRTPIAQFRNMHFWI